MLRNTMFHTLFRVSGIALLLLSGRLDAKKERQSIEERNQQADKAFLAWKLQAPHSKLSASLKKALTPPAISFIAKESQLSFEKPVTQTEIKKKIQNISAQVMKKFGSAKVHVNERELAQLLEVVIKPEFIFQEAKNPVGELGNSYNELLENLAQEETPIGTTLKEWALRFLTSESLDVALPIIERVTIDGKTFNQLTPKEQNKVFDSIGSIITQRFMSNVRAVRAKFKFDLPLFVDEAVKQKIVAFLRAKFIN